MPFVQQEERRHGLFVSTLNANGVHPGTPAVAGITEVDSNHEAIRGNALMRVLNVVPRHGRFEVVADILFEHDLTARITVIYQ